MEKTGFFVDFSFQSDSRDIMWCKKFSILEKKIVEFELL